MDRASVLWVQYQYAKSIADDVFTTWVQHHTCGVRGISTHRRQLGDVFRCDSKENIIARIFSRCALSPDKRGARVSPRLGDAESDLARAVRTRLPKIVAQQTFQRRYNGPCGSFYQALRATSLHLPVFMPCPVCAPHAIARLEERLAVGVVRNVGSARHLS